MAASSCCSPDQLGAADGIHPSSASFWDFCRHVNRHFDDILKILTSIRAFGDWVWIDVWHVVRKSGKINTNSAGFRKCLNKGVNLKKFP